MSAFCRIQIDFVEWPAGDNVIRNESADNERINLATNQLIVFARIFSFSFFSVFLPFLECYQVVVENN